MGFRLQCKSIIYILLRESLKHYQSLMCPSYMAMFNSILKDKNEYFNYESIKTLLKMSLDLIIMK